MAAKNLFSSYPSECSQAKELKWIPEDFQSVLLTLSQLVAAELHELTDLEKEPQSAFKGRSYENPV